MNIRRPQTDYTQEPLGCEYCGYMRRGGEDTDCKCPICLSKGYWYALLGPREMRWRADQWIEQGYTGQGRKRHVLADKLEALL